MGDIAVAAMPEPQTAIAIDDDFVLADLRIYDSIPPYPYYGIAALRGMVAVYETDVIAREGIIEGCYYVRETQRPVACMDWRRWLDLELDDRSRRIGPRSPLEIRREVVRAMRWRDDDHWAVRLESGVVDGPYQHWAFGLDLIGKVTGLYMPG